MKKIFTITFIILIIIGTPYFASCFASGMTNNNPKEEATKTTEKTITKEIVSITAQPEHNRVVIQFADDDYIDANWQSLFFTETYGDECVIKTYDEYNNLVNIHVFYNPNTTEILHN